MIAITLTYQPPVVVEPRYLLPSEGHETPPEASDDEVR